MASLPSYVGMVYSATQEKPSAAVNRAEMDRGMPKQALVNSRTPVQLKLTFDFATPADADAFLDWYFDEIKVVGQFNMPHPRSGATITAQFVGGDIGALVPVEGVDRPWQCDVQLEYLR